ncbi:ABC transporter permease [Eremococcus coleocola]|nr:ABC transporter permease [Eremococcus coleocola]
MNPQEPVPVEEQVVGQLEEFESKPPMGLEVIVREFLHDKVAMFSLFILVAIVLFAFIAPFFMDETKAQVVNLFGRYKEPGVDGYLLGSNEGGQDILTLLVIGTRNSLFIGFMVTIFTSVIGIAIGIMAGYYGGIVDDIVMRIIDFLMVLPIMMIIIVIVTIIPRFNMWTLIILLSAFYWVGNARLFRTATLSEGSKDYVSASKTMGTRDWKIMYMEVMPNLSSLIITYLTLNFAGNIGVETGLSFLGFGLPFGTPSLGTLISTASNPDVIQNKWWVWLPAVILILVLMLSISYIGQAMQRAFDSRQRIG